MSLIKGKLIVIEGVDGCGKTTQSDLLQKRLRKENIKVKVVDFPRYYNSVWGKIVGNFLKGDYGNFDKTSPYLVTLPYMIDQYTWGRDFGKKLLINYKVVLSNRYFTSNAHQIAKLKGQEREKFRKWLWYSGYKKLGIIKPDLVLFLDVDPVIAYTLNKNKKSRKYLDGKNEDEAEKRLDHQQAAYKEYLKTSKHFRYWKVIKCMTNDKIDKPMIIHDRIWKTVQKYI